MCLCDQFPCVSHREARGCSGAVDKIADGRMALLALLDLLSAVRRRDESAAGEVTQRRTASAVHLLPPYDDDLPVNDGMFRL